MEETAGCSAVTVDAPPDDPGGAATPNAANKAEIVSAWPPLGAAAELDIALVGGAVTAGTCTIGKTACARVLIPMEYACSSQV